MKPKHFLLILLFTTASADTLTLTRRMASPGGIRGAAVSRTALWTWGNGLYRWLGAKPVKIAGGEWGEGGCAADMNLDGRQDIVLQRGGDGLGELVWLEAPSWREHKLDTEVEMPDCIAATLFGRRGVLMIQRGMQIRFYEWRDGKPAVREIYSIYTPSRQAGLALVDINRDGRADILCGNYWVQSPARFDLPWRIFAIDIWFEEPRSASMTLAWLPGQGRIAAQSEMDKGKVGLFRPPPNVKDAWPVTLLAEARRPGTFAAGETIFVVEDAGPTSRLMAFRKGKQVIQYKGVSAIAGFARTRHRLLLITRNAVEEWRYFWRK